MSLSPIRFPSVGISGTRADQTTSGGLTLKPFSGVIVSDTDETAILTVTVTVSILDYLGVSPTPQPDMTSVTLFDPTLNPTSVYQKNGPTFVIQGSASLVTNVLNNLQLTFAGAGVSPNRSVTTLNVAAADTKGYSTASSTVVTTTAPTLAVGGLPSNFQVGPQQPIKPFEGTTVTDVNPAARITASIDVRISDIIHPGSTQDTFSPSADLANFQLQSETAQLGAGSPPLVITGTASEVTRALNAVVATFPTTSQAGNVTETSVTISLSDQTGQFASGVTQIVGNYPAVPTSAYRFFDKAFGTRFFTNSAAERDQIVSTRPDLVQETNNFGSVGYGSASSVSVYRFFDTHNGTHFFTANAVERNNVVATRPDLVFEPFATFFEHMMQQPGDVPVYRFFNTNVGTHFYTGSEVEKEAITTNAGLSTYRPDLKFEGTGFYAPAGLFQ